jgi:hypothetical protein
VSSGRAEPGGGTSNADYRALTLKRFPITIGDSVVRGIDRVDL